MQSERAVSKRPFKPNQINIMSFKGNEKPIRLYRVIYLSFESEDGCSGWIDAVAHECHV